MVSSSFVYGATMSVGDPIQRHKKLTGSGLNEAIINASKPPSGGVDVAVISSGKDAVIKGTGPKPRRRVQWFGVVISAVVFAPGQWLYIVRERIKQSPGYGGWVDKLNGREVPAWHYSEDMNTGEGVENHGINVDELPGTFATQPLPVDSRVVVTEVRLADGSTLEYWFTDSMNGVDGSCP